MAPNPPAPEKQPMFVEPHDDDHGPCHFEQDVTNQGKNQPIPSRATNGEYTQTQHAKQNQSVEESYHAGLVAEGAAVLKQTGRQVVGSTCEGSS